MLHLEVPVGEDEEEGEEEMEGREQLKIERVPEKVHLFWST